MLPAKKHQMIKRSAYIAMVLAFVFFGEVKAQSSEPHPNALQIEDRVHTVSKELRCLVCQNQAIIDSNAPLAKQMKQIVRERIQAGDTNEEAKTYLVARYGDWILLKPPFRSNTIILWLGPFIILILILLIGWRTIYRTQHRQQFLKEKPLSKNEEKKLKNMIGKRS